MHCGQPGGLGPRELRPYGPGGKDVCAECMFNGPPERLEHAKGVFAAQLAMAGEAPILDAREQVGPRPSKPTGSA